MTNVSYPIVGIGASAGGVEALEQFFNHMPADTGCSFVVVTHLAPERRSLLPEILARHTQMPVQAATDGAVPQPNQIYVMPPDALMGIRNRALTLKRPILGRRERKPIDYFFSELAIDIGELAVGVVLSGGDGDGTLGVKAIKERAGFTLAQTVDGTAPQYSEMPQSAISSGMVDLAVPVTEMGSHIPGLSRGVNGLDILKFDQDQADQKALEKVRTEICAMLRSQLGHDFLGYKPKTFLRRVQRRMQVNGLDSLEGYIERLRQDPKEINALFRDLLITVTNFFRDADAFEALKSLVIPKLFAGRGADDSVRVWVPGCATGEEVFSIAILMREHMETLRAVPRVQIFATDIDDSALSVARAARYPEALLDSVSEERRKKYFTQDQGSYLLTKDVRDLCVFSPHSVIRDPPFARIDLVSCRNLLIYFGPDVQSQVIPTFVYALRPGGYLFLGTSENIGQFSELFMPVDKKNRMFRSREDAPNTARVPFVVGGWRPAPIPMGQARATPRLGGLTMRNAVEGQVLDRYAPAHVVVNRDGDIIYYSAHTGKYLEPMAGAPNRQIMTLAKKGLRLDLRAILRELIETELRVVREGASVETDGGDRIQTVDLSAEPLIDSPGDDRLFLIVFRDVGPVLSREEIVRRRVAGPDEAAVHLERELRETRERLQSLIEEYETALEELKSSNEELVSVNEELQSTNEELEASKEELQSVNEELHTVNGELSGKVDALDRSNADLANLFESTKVATIFLDRNLTIRSFTPAVSQFINLLPGDRGRPFTDLSGRIETPDLIQDLRSVLGNGEVVERSLSMPKTMQHYLIRVAPYRDVGQVEGVILSFIDVTSLVQADALKKTVIGKLNHRMRHMLSAVVSLAEQSSQTKTDADGSKDRFMDRIRAMARSYELFSDENWTSVGMGEVARQQLEPFGLKQVHLGSEEIELSARQALALSMVLHELATNAAKYGALSAKGGRLDLDWQQRDGEIVLSWAEMGGPSVTKPSKQGFGMKFITKNQPRRFMGRRTSDLLRMG